MTEPSQNQSCLPGCQALIPPELQQECRCILHYTLGIEHACAEMRREMAMEKISETRQFEITNYIKIASMKLSEVAVGNAPLSDALKRRILTTFLTLMNLRESLVRSASRRMPELPIAKAPVAAVPVPIRITRLRRVRA